MLAIVEFSLACFLLLTLGNLTSIQKEKCQGSFKKKEKSQCVFLRNVILLFFRGYIKQKKRNLQKYIIPNSMLIIFA